MKKDLDLSEVLHGRNTVSTEVDGEKVQVDRFEVHISTSALPDAGRSLLHLWAVEELDYACIDWAEGQIKLFYRTAHYIPEDCVQDDMEEVF